MDARMDARKEVRKEGCKDLKEVRYKKEKMQWEQGKSQQSISSQGRFKDVNLEHRMPLKGTEVHIENTS